MPVMTRLQPAADAVLYLVKCVAVEKTNAETTGAAVEGRVSLAQIYAAAATTRQGKRVTISI